MTAPALARHPPPSVRRHGGPCGGRASSSSFSASHFTAPAKSPSRDHGLHAREHPPRKPYTREAMHGPLVRKHRVNTLDARLARRGLSNPRSALARARCAQSSLSSRSVSSAWSPTGECRTRTATASTALARTRVAVMQAFLDRALGIARRRRQHRPIAQGRSRSHASAVASERAAPASLVGMSSGTAVVAERGSAMGVGADRARAVDSRTIATNLAANASCSNSTRSRRSLPGAAQHPAIRALSKHGSRPWVAGSM